MILVQLRQMLDDLAEKRQLTDISRRADVSIQTLHNIRMGRNTPNLAVVEAICGSLGMVLKLERSE